jgi:hypothetical protein
VTGYNPTGIGLTVVGASTFSLSGVATVAAGKKSVTVSRVALRRASLVLATIQQVATGYTVASAVPNATSSQIVIHLNEIVAATFSSGIRVAWFVVN